MRASELLDTIRIRGGIVALDGDLIRYDLSGDAAPLITDLIARRDEIRRELKERHVMPIVPTGFRLVAWNPKPAPVIIESIAVIGDSDAFSREKLKQLSAAKKDPIWGRIIPQLLDQLAQVGVILTDKQ